ncbi:MAG: TIGR04372 family glycosyltransferase [Prosthecobacter sp.]|jgi:putative glycosyltransferase (TIGR04372 family)
MKLPEHWKPLPTVKDGYVDGSQGTKLTLGWVLLHPLGFIKLALKSPRDVFRYLTRHPRMFLTGHSKRRSAGAADQKPQGTGSRSTEIELVRLFQAKKIRVFEITNPVRIGHQVGELDVWLREKRLAPADATFSVLALSEDDVANKHFWTYTRPLFDWTISLPAWNELKRSYPELGGFAECRYDYFHAYDESAACFPVFAAWGERPPLFQMTAEDQEFLHRELAEWGLGEKDWFVCLHNRERGYSAKDDDIHDYRNAAIETYFPAIEEIVRRGGWVFRMGDPSMSPIQSSDKIIDYAHSSRRSPRLDILLCASAKFMIGCSSGLSLVSTAFGIPVLNVNLAPISMHAYTSKDIALPKLYYSEQEGRLLRFDEAFSHPASNYRFGNLFKRDGIRVVDNDERDILEATLEMLAKVFEEPGSAGDESSALSKRYNRLFKPGHFGYCSAGAVSPTFLKRYHHLMPENTGPLA